MLHVSWRLWPGEGKHGLILANWTWKSRFSTRSPETPEGAAPRPCWAGQETRAPPASLHGSCPAQAVGAPCRWSPHSAPNREQGCPHHHMLIGEVLALHLPFSDTTLGAPGVPHYSTTQGQVQTPPADGCWPGWRWDLRIALCYLAREEQLLSKTC